METSLQSLHKGQVLNNIYTVECFVGSGAFGAVYRVNHKHLGRQTLKLLSHRSFNTCESTDILQEAKILSILTHKNVVRVFDAGIIKIEGIDHYFISMEFISGETLENLLGREILLPVETSLSLISDVLAGISFAHDNNPTIIHGDISPDNILLSYDEEIPKALVSDFGLAQAIDDLSSLPSARGKIAYLAPESYFGVFTGASDVFSSALVLYRMLTGTLPWDTLAILGNADCIDSGISDLRRYQKHKPVPPSILNPLCTPQLDGIVMQALSFDIEDRFSNGSAFLDELRQVSNDTASSIAKYQY